MKGHTAEPLYTLVFETGAIAIRFIDVIRHGISSDPVHRHTPPGPLVIYGPENLSDDGPITLYVTVGILRAAEIMRVSVPERGPELDGAASLPDGTVVLLAALGGTGVEAVDE